MTTSKLLFTRWLAAVGVLGGVAIALGLPYLVLAHGVGLGGGAQVTLIILALLVGASLAGVSAVVGITVPTAITGGGIGLACICEPECEPRGPGGPGAAEEPAPQGGG